MDLLGTGRANPDLRRASQGNSLPPLSDEHFRVLFRIQWSIRRALAGPWQVQKTDLVPAPAELPSRPRRNTFPASLDQR